MAEGEELYREKRKKLLTDADFVSKLKMEDLRTQNSENVYLTLKLQIHETYTSGRHILRQK